MKYESFELSNISGGGSFCVPIPENYRDCVRLLQSDYFRVYGKTASLIVIWFTSIRNHCIKYLLWMRLSAYRRGWLYPLCKLRQEHYGKKFCIDIPPSTRIGYGFYLGHGFSIVVNRTAVIGNNVNLSQCVTIGSNCGHAAWIGDNVYIGPNSCVVEDVHICSDTLIGAGSVVTKSIEPNVTAVGSPCKAIGDNAHPEYIKNRWNRKNNQ